MYSLRFLVFATTSLAVALGVVNADPPRVPTGHPEVSTPTTPPGHPADAPTPVLPDALADAPHALPADVISPATIVNAYYNSISGPRGQARDWARFRSLFVPGALFSTPRMINGARSVTSITVARFVASNDRYFEKGGYFETPIGMRTTEFGSVAQVFSAYEARRGLAESAPYLRGVNGFQLINDGDRWWIVNVIWDIERADGSTIPPDLIDRANAG
jgi:hypothetical protein